MTTALVLIAQLFSAAPVVADTRPDGRAQAPAAPLISRASVDWAALRRLSHSEPADTPVTRPRAQAIEYGNGYHTRLKLHRVMSFAMIPFFIGSYVTGDKLLDDDDGAAPGWARSLHKPFALGTGVLFTANTITGVWNLWESRKDPAGRFKRYLHALTFIAATAGFAYVAVNAPGSNDSDDTARRHRNVALVSMGLSVTSWGLMLFFK
jgi:hypothetical protein